MQCNCNCRLQTDPARINISNVWCLRWYDTIFDIITRVSSRHLISQELYCNSMHFVIRLVSGLIAQRHTALTRNIFNKSWVSTSRYKSNSVCFSICWFINTTENLKGGEQSPDSRTGGCRKMAPNGWNDLKFCMQGSFVGYIWVLAKLRSHSLYGGQTNISHF